MLSDNLQRIVDMIGQLADLDLKENDADPNMVYAYGWAAGALLKEIADLKLQGR